MKRPAAQLKKFIAVIEKYEDILHLSGNEAPLCYKLLLSLQ